MKYVTFLFVLFLTTPVFAESEEIIVIIKKKAQEDKPVVSTNQVVSNKEKEIKTIEDVYKRWETWPGQMFLDSPSGPKMMLGMDVVYDKDGLPVPRLPDPYTFAVMKDPDNYKAYTDYLDWRKAVIRRTRLAMNKVPDVAIEMGYVTEETVSVKENRPYDNRMVGDLSKIESSSLGTPLYEGAKARELGMEAKDNPVFPGTPPESGISVYWFWHQRCHHCKTMARNWFSIQRVLNDHGYEAMSINLSKDNAEVAAAIEIFKITMGEDVDYSKNWLDWTGLQKSLNITSTPTVIAVNRKTNQIKRMVGNRGPHALKALVAEVGGWSAETWPPPKYGKTQTKELDTLDVHEPQPEQATPLGTYE